MDGQCIAEECGERHELLFIKAQDLIGLNLYPKHKWLSTACAGSKEIRTALVP